MRAFRPKSFRQQAAAEARRSDGLTDAQHKALLAEFDRRMMNFKEQWDLCSNRRCRRHRQCLGPPFACKSDGGERPWTEREYRRLRRDILRNPPGAQTA